MNRTHKISLLIALYLAQGLPYGFFTLALPVFLREAGYSLVAISALSWLSLPWALKFLWAPYLDRLWTRRALLLTLQTASIVGAIVLTRVDLDSGYVALLMAAFAFNLIAASQDVVTDGLAVRMLDTRERGLGNGIQVGAYRLGMMFGGGFLLIVYDYTKSWMVMFTCMAVLLALTMLPVVTMREPDRPVTVAHPGLATLAITWARRLLSPGMLGFVGLIFCYRYGDQMVTTLLSPFLSDQALDKKTIGLMKGVVGNMTSLVGAVLGGWFAFAVSRRRAVLWSGVAQAASFTLYITAALGFGGVALLWVATIVEGVIGTMATVALFTLMMDASDHEHAGTDYTLFASSIVLVSIVGNLSGAAIGDALGYAAAFSVGAVLALAGCLAVVWTLDRKPIPERVGIAWARS
jgi:PAT family beta-lactamase induction signal transducer AmpG